VAILNRWARPVDGASLAVLRVATGAVLCWEVGRFFIYGWIPRYYTRPSFFFHYFGFEWIEPWPGVGMYVHFLGLGLLAIGVAFGRRQRLCALLLGFGWSYVFLLDQSNYLNHLYLVCLLCFLLAWIPAGRDAVPAWSLAILRFQIGAVYVFGGLAKLNGDWLRGQPLLRWLHSRADMALVGPVLAEPVTAYLFSYGGLLLDLLVVPFLMWRKTRTAAFILVIVFNIANAVIFSIGIFPWLMIALTTVFFAPDWPRRVWSQRLGAAPSLASTGGFSNAAKVIFVLWVAIQVALPLRHWVYPGAVSWTEEGHRFSWHMKLRSKRGRVRFHVLDTTSGETWTIDPRDELSKRQARKLSTRPDMILQFAHHLRDRFRKQGRSGVAVHANSRARLNDRARQPLIDPEVDLAAVERSLLPASWIVPLRR
jgi:vitamin K-dependent gamma-carboxylase